MELFLGPGTTQGQQYLPDELAKQIIADMKLEKGQTLSKAAIVAYLTKHGVSSLLATDVAMMLRNVYGVTPTFDEDRNMSTNIVSEMNEILNENYDQLQEAKFDSPVMTEDQVRELHQWAIQECFNESKDEVDEMIVARLAMMTPRQVEDIALLDDFMEEEHYDQVEECLARGGRGLAEAWFEVFVRPHRFRFLPEEVQVELKQISEALPVMALAGQAARRTAGTIVKRDPANTSLAQDKRAARAKLRSGHQDPLAARQAPDVRDPEGRGHFAKMAADRQSMRSKIDWADKGKQIQGKQHQDVNIEKQKIQSRMAKQGTAPLPQDPGPGLGSRIKQGAKTALGAVGDVGSMLGRGAAAAGRGVAAAGQGLGKAAGAVAGGAAAGVGHLAGRYQAAKAASAGAAPAGGSQASKEAPTTSTATATGGGGAEKEHPVMALLRQHFGADHPVTQLAHQHLGTSATPEPEPEQQTAMAHHDAGAEEQPKKHGILRRMVGWAARGLGKVANRVGQSIKHGIRSRMPTTGHVLFGPESSGEAELAGQKVRQAQRKLASAGRYVPRYGGEGGGTAGGGGGGSGRRPPSPGSRAPVQRPGWRR